MSVDKEKRNRVLQRIGAIAVVVFFAIGSWFLVRHEDARSRDAQSLARILEIQAALASYASHHGVYPYIGKTQLSVGSAQTGCLSSDGFVSANSDSCRQKTFGLFGQLPGKGKSQIAAYSSLDSDAITQCADKDGCPMYKIDFILETNSIAPKGLHSVSPNGLQ